MNTNQAGFAEKIDFQKHNDEVKAVWDAFHKRKPFRVPVIVGGSIRNLFSNPEVNKTGYTFEDWKDELRSVTNTSGEWIATVADWRPVESVGFYSSIKVDSDGYEHIAYRNKTGFAQVYATNRDGEWTVTMLDNSFNTGYWSSLALDSWDRPHILYCDKDNSLLMYSHFDGENWQFTVVAPIGDARSCYASLDLDSQDHAHATYTDSRTADLYYVSNYQGYWDSSVIDSADEVGSYADISVDESDSVHISYRNRTRNSLWYAH